MPRAKPKADKVRRRPGFWSRLRALLRRLFARPAPAPQAPKKPRRLSPRDRLLPAGGARRSLAQWKELRRQTTAEVKAHLAEEQPVPAIKKLTRALLEDPQHPPYHELLKKAVEQRRRRRIKAGRQDPWAELPRELRQEALQLEAFSAYVDELEQLFDKAGIPPLSAPPPPGVRQAQAKAAAAGAGPGRKQGGSKGGPSPKRRRGGKRGQAGARPAESPRS